MTTQSVEKKRELIIVKRESGVALIMFDSAGKFNSLGSGTMVELNEVLSLIESDNSIKAVVGISGKPDSFIIGADLYEIRKADSKEALLRLSRNGQELLNRISSFKKPFVIAINGACLGGGLEIALATHARVATRNEKTILGLPETRLGLIPGCGGTQRLPRLVGLKVALDMILSANTISADKALEIGLVDELVEPDRLIEAAEKKALSLIGSPEWEKLVRKNADETGLQPVKASSYCLTDLTQEKAEKLLTISERAIRLRTKGHYPAQTEALKVIRSGLNGGFMAGLKAEAEAFAELGSGEVAANLIALFFNTDLARGTAQALVQKNPGSQVQTIGIVGSGTMGASLAQLAAANGIKVFLKTSNEKVSEINELMYQMAQRNAHHMTGSKAETDQVFDELFNNILDNIHVVSHFEKLSDADLIIECVIEDSEAKASVISQIADVAKQGCVIVTNTSALSVTELAKSTKQPENFLGLHFFHPVDRMPLVEMIAQPATNKATLARATDLALRLEKTPLVTKDKPGFLINRLLTVYLFEVARLAEEKTPVNWIEEALLDFGMPMGPIQLLDEIGIDVAFTVAKNLADGLGARLAAPEIFRQACELGLQGKRGNVGLYLWQNSEKKLGFNPEFLSKTAAVVSDEKPTEEEKARIIDRALLAMLDEAARCLEEKVVSRPREIDYALILGVGFPAFRGGLLKYADHRGLKNLVPIMDSFYAETLTVGTAGERTVSTLLKKYAEENRGFYSLAGAKED
jgi:3-hydroxyacyl-CoA dehydrogenase/enoyl-CoA hydratase/3-hydroxybutyryl-CoA epimerase